VSATDPNLLWLGENQDKLLLRLSQVFSGMLEHEKFAVLWEKRVSEIQEQP